MNNVILKYILFNFIKSLLVVVLIIFCFGVILNLFEEIEFFKNLNVNIFKPLLLTSLFVPSLVLKLLPFIKITKQNVVNTTLKVFISKS